MDRYIVTQLLMPFLFGVGAFSSIVLAVGSLFDLVRQVAEAGLPITIALEVMALKMPQYITFAFPMSILLSGMMTYGSFSASSEIVAFRSCGISVYRLILPAIIMSFIVTAITFFFNELLVPVASQRATTILTTALKQDKPTFNTENIVKPIYKEVERDGKKEQVLAWLFYAEKFDGKTMTGLTILDRSKADVGLSQIINAQSAVLDAAKNSWDFYNGTIYIISPNSSYGNIVNFTRQHLQLPSSPFDIAALDNRNPDDMSVAESLEYLEQVKLTGDKKKALTVAVKIQNKLALPFVCIVFSAIGSATGIRPQRTGKATSFGVSVLMIFGYYLIMFVCGALGQAEVISPFLAGWLPNFIGLAIGGWLVAQAAK
ncbi:LptF/LptG family permease [Chamaesiphon minutus]|uniref:Putative permease n=1 Tax=Chamaesiphon minutus (strain ATCC 27169 / PCC 6605) TaxID=1173020 RepID=K9UK90_CHAP6|nr:putative permease [Chamaesiphon minutus PCC 6605]